MKKYFWIILIAILIILGIAAVLFFNRKDNDNSGYETTRISADTNNVDENASPENNTIMNRTDNNIIKNNTVENTITEEAKAPEKKEEALSSFVTNVVTKDPERQHNLQLTCNRLNGYIIPKGAVFSFCETLGPSTADKGYQKAGVIDQNGNDKKAYGGGNCQISTTLYNAVLQVPELAVIERHPHSKSVPYIEDGKDAAVAYGSYDFKFQNNTGFDIKITTEPMPDTIKINLIKIL